MKKIKFTKDMQKIINYCVLYGSFKNFSEIESSNQRINIAGRLLWKARILKRNIDGYSLDYDSNPDLRSLRDYFGQAEVRQQLKIGSVDKQTLRWDPKCNLHNIICFSQPWLKEMARMLKKAGYKPSKTAKK